MGNEIHAFYNFRIITAGGLGALCYLFTFHFCFNFNITLKTYLIGITFGIFTTLLYWLLDNNYKTYHVFFSPLIIALWQVGIATIIYKTGTKRVLCSRSNAVRVSISNNQ